MQGSECQDNECRIEGAVVRGCSSQADVEQTGQILSKVSRSNDVPGSSDQVREMEAWVAIGRIGGRKKDVLSMWSIRPALAEINDESA